MAKAPRLNLDDDFVRLDDQTTPNNTAVQQQQQQNGTNLSFEPPSSMEMDELKLKVAALEAKNQMLEGKLENLELKSHIHELKEEIYGHKLKEVEQKAEMANNQLKSTLLPIQQKMADFEQMGKELKAELNRKLYNLNPEQRALAMSIFDFEANATGANQEREEDKNWTPHELEDDGDPWTIRDPTVWQGTFVWSKLIQFECSMRAISNRAAWKAGPELMTTIHVLGKSESKGVWDYVRKLKNSLNKQVILAVIEPAPNQVRQYQQCYEKINLSSHFTQEIAVLNMNGHEQIKDGYLISLEPNERLPKILLPLEGAGLPDWCKRKGCIVVMLIRRMDSEDRLWRESLPTMPACNIPLEAVGPENRDPRLDENVTKQSKIYKPRTQMVEDDQQGEGFPCVESVADLLDAIQLIDKPGRIIKFVGHYLETHPELTDEQRQLVLNAVRARSAVELQRIMASAAAKTELTSRDVTINKH